MKKNSVNGDGIEKNKRPKAFALLFIAMIFTTFWSFLGIYMFASMKFLIWKQETLCWFEIIIGELLALSSFFLLFGISKMKNAARKLYLSIQAAIVAYIFGWLVVFISLAYKIGWDSNATAVSACWAFHILFPTIFILYLSSFHVKEKFK